MSKSNMEKLIVAKTVLNKNPKFMGPSEKRLMIRVIS